MSWQDIALGMTVGTLGIVASFVLLGVAFLGLAYGYLYSLSALCRLPKAGESWRDWRTGELIAIDTELPTGGYLLETSKETRYEDEETWRRAARHRYRIRR